MKTSAKYLRQVVGPRPGTSSQNWTKTYLTYDITHKKMKPKTKNFFSSQTQRLAESFDGLNSSLAQLAEELCGW